MRRYMRPSTAPSVFSAGRIEEIDGLRGLAILAVMLHRFWPLTGPLGAYAEVVVFGWTGVDLFFVISGFLVAGILIDTRNGHHFLRNFYARRALRILPLYYAYTVVVFSVMPLLQGGAYSDTAFIRASGSPLWYLLFLGNFPEALGTDPPFLLGHLWSLAIEEQFYLFFPLIVLVSGSRLAQVLLGAVAVAAASRLVGTVLLPDNERLQYLATPCRMDSLAMGCLLAVLVRGRLNPALTKFAPKVLLAAALLAAGATATGGLTRTTLFARVLGYSLVATVFAGVLLFTLANRGARSTAMLRFAPLRHLGRVCYASYLLHRPVDVVVDRAMLRLGSDELTHSATAIFTKIALTIAAASLSWRLFEQPILALKRHFERGGRPHGENDPVAPQANADATRLPLVTSR